MNLYEKMWELQPVKDARASFYRKAFVHVHFTSSRRRVNVLYSYETPVCMLRQIGNREQIKQSLIYEVIVNKDIDDSLLFSQTTLRHIKEFLYQYANIDIKTKKELLKIVKYGRIA